MHLAYVKEGLGVFIIYYLDKIESLNVLTRVIRDHRADHEMLHTARVGITSGWFTT